MAFLGLNFKVSKHSKNDYRTTFQLFYAKKKLKLKKDKLLESGGNANFKQAKWPLYRFSMAVLGKFVKQNGQK